MSDTTAAQQALLNYTQADRDGVMVFASRQAIHEVCDELDRLRAVNAALLDFPVMFLGWREYSSHGEFPFDRLYEAARAAIAAAKGSDQ
jgi:hypothetical protein